MTGKTLRVSANAPARQPTKIPPNRVKKLRNKGEEISIGCNKINKLPKVTPVIIAVSTNRELLFVLYFSDSFSNTPRSDINATYPAAIAPPAIRQNRM